MEKWDSNASAFHMPEWMVSYLASYIADGCFISGGIFRSPPWDMVVFSWNEGT